MEDIDPFAQPPLVEWENCLTIDELQTILEKFTKIRNGLPWWRYWEKKKYDWTVGTVLGMLLVVKSKPFGEIHE